MTETPPIGIICADSAQLLPSLPDHSFDALCTDPPAGIGFMGKEWDDFRRQRNIKDAGRDSVYGRMSRSGPEYGRRDRQHFIEWLASILRECRRVLKPGAYGWVWAIPRTSHWTATACEDAGFAVRDVLVHVQSQGFPKSRALLKPAAEHWILIKAPGELRELRIDENRIPGRWTSWRRSDGSISPKEGHSSPMPMNRDGKIAENKERNPEHPAGRWPSNFALSHSPECKEWITITEMDEGIDTCADDCPVKLLDEQSGDCRSAGNYKKGSRPQGIKHGAASIPIDGVTSATYADSGGASRFFYVAKSSTKERSAGLPEGARNTHTTVKSIALMRHLLRLIAAPGDRVLDPFAGSGSTGLACKEEGMGFLGIEQSEEYAQIARARIGA